jgi:hypothetical protein
LESVYYINCIQSAEREVVENVEQVRSNYPTQSPLSKLLGCPGPRAA